VRFLVARVSADGEKSPAERVLPRRCDVLALGGPVVGPGFPEESPRGVERMFSLGKFQKLCRAPATSAGDRDAELRRAAAQCLDELLRHVRTSREMMRFPHVVPNASVVETSPLLFLHVMLDEEGTGKRSTGRNARLARAIERSDREGRLAALRALLDWRDDGFWSDLAEPGDHGQSAAAICSLAAVGVVRRRYVAVGDLRAGFFFLPPWELWADWAKRAIADNRRRDDLDRGMEIWINAHPRDLRAKLPA
jgi:hypothetical protein